jgi:hypothetical protein
MMGKTERVLEVSNYPRFAADPYVVSHHHTWLKERFTDYAAKNTEAHVYKEDTPFTATEDLVDSKGKAIKKGETATHFKGEPLPGSFPLWLKRETDGETKTDYEFDLTGLPYPITSIVEVNINRGHGWEELDKRGLLVDSFRSFCNLATRNIGGWYEGKVTIPKQEGDSDKVLVRISYHRRLR